MGGGEEGGDHHFLTSSNVVKFTRCKVQNYEILQ